MIPVVIVFVGSIQSYRQTDATLYHITFKRLVTMLVTD